MNDPTLETETRYRDCPECNGDGKVLTDIGIEEQYLVFETCNTCGGECQLPLDMEDGLLDEADLKLDR